MRTEDARVCCPNHTWRTSSHIYFVSHPINDLYSARLRHSIDIPLKQISKPTTAYLDESDPILKIPIWRGCSAARETVDSTWLPALEQPAKIKEEEETRSAEENEALAELFRVKMMDIPWVKAAARAAERQNKAKKQKRKKKQVSGEKKDAEV
jgi:hypothetical protein